MLELNNSNTLELQEQPIKVNYVLFLQRIIIMLKKNIFFLLILCFSYMSSYTQNISLVASNQVDNDHVLHTLKLSSNNSSANYSDDNLVNQPVNQKIENFISFAENKKGVFRVTYDNATTTFSILSDNIFDIQYLINTNNPLNEASE